MTGLIAQVLLLAALAGTVGLGGAGWVVGVDLRSDHERGTGARPLPLPLATGWARPTG